MTYYAKSTPTWVTNKEHLSKVSDLAYKFGIEIDMPEAAGIAGQFHDVGKYGESFQQVLLGTKTGIDHAFSSAAFLYSVKRLSEKNHNSIVWKKYEPIIEAIQGHHDGLFSLEKLNPEFDLVLKNPQMDFCHNNKTPSLRGKDEFENAWERFKADFPIYRPPEFPNRIPSNEVEDMLDTRMLFSCLVDADYSVSASDKDPDYLRKNSKEPLDAEKVLSGLYEYYEKLRKSSTADSKLNQIRDQVFEICGDAGERPTGLFTLTAPTGVGKTLAMMHFALRHCKMNHLKRIIVVLPFLTLAEQSEKEYRRILEDILVDHSQKDLSKEVKELASRWDAPMIITTSVKFFESLFSDKPGECRKLHSIAKSVVLFDEAQSLPPELASVTVKAINALCKKYHCSMVFSTATQPDFGALPNTEWNPVEILSENKLLYRKMHRVCVDWRLYTGKERIDKTTSLDKIAEEMAAETSVCAIVNLRRQARKLFEKLKNNCANATEVFLLTTDLCPAHRIAVVNEIKERLKANPPKPCRVVATQCIEAGVDLDFDVMYRELAPLEAIIQAAGRCNRNGRLDEGRLIVFELSEEKGYPDAFYEKAAQVVKRLWENSNGVVDLDDPDTISKYYVEIFNEAKGKKGLDNALIYKDYLKVAREYKLITDDGVRLIVPWSREACLFDEIKAELETNGLTAEIIRKSAKITVACFEKDWVEQHAEKLYFHRKHYGEKIESGYYILNVGQEKYYDEMMGLKLEDVEAEDYIV